MAVLRLLGSIDATDDDGQAVELSGARPRRVLAALHTAGGHLSLEELADMAFDEDDRPDDPVPAIRTAVRRARSALGNAAVLTRQGGYQLADDVETDVSRFEALLAAGAEGSDPIQRERSLREALALWRGTPFGDLGDLEWLQAERIRLEELHLQASERWFEAKLRTGAATEILPALEGAVAAHPLRDKLRRHHMMALYKSGRQADALRAYQDYRKHLAEAGLEPPEETVGLDARIASDDPSLTAPTTDERTLRGYRLSERLGEGAFSVVYRGTQPSVGRAVAIKQIRAELANRPEFIRRFEAEAHMVARLEHPHIVPLIDYWREPGSAYLVMRLLPAGTLESSVLEGPWSIERTTRMVDQIGAALASAHRSGVVHRDVKSANILLDDEGNTYLTDFGIALEANEVADPAAALSAGSPAYASPEQLRREPVGPAADVHGLGIATYEALTGHLPFPDEPSQAALLRRQLHDPIPLVRQGRSDIPPAVDEVLQRATAKRVDERYADVTEFVEAFRGAASGSGGAPSRPRESSTIVRLDDRNPYKGLHAFDEADEQDFAGRERLVDELVERLRSHRLVTVVGPSGSGKSSVVRAGLLPAVRAGAIQTSDEWFVATMSPGARPYEELEAALVGLSADLPADLLDVLSQGERGISRGLRRSLPNDGELLLVIDQFEELFTLCPDEEKRQQFLAALASALTEERPRLRVILTLRADFFDRPLRYESIGRLVRDSTVAVLPLAADELERAIVEPAHAVGAELEPGLVSELVADVADQPGALPMLQYALTELYERRISGLMTRDAYHELGGVAGALAARAEQIFAGAPPAQQTACRAVFGRLVNPGEGAEDTRRRARLSEVASSVDAEAILSEFGGARLLSFDRDPATREPTVEVAHEALIREWPRLRTWLDEDRDDLRTHQHLARAAAEWDAAARPDSELYRGGRLETAETWARDAAGLTDTEVAFVAASTQARSAAEEAERRTNRRLRRLLVGVGCVAVVALTAGLFALVERNRAEDALSEAEDEREAADDARLEAQTALGEAEDARGEAESASAEAETARDLALESQSDAESTRRQEELRRMTADALILRDTNPELALLLAAAVHRERPDAVGLSALQRVMRITDGFLGSIGPDRAYLDVGFAGEAALAAVHRAGIEIWDLDRRTLALDIDLPGITSFSTHEKAIHVLLDTGVLRTLDALAGETLAEVDTGLSGPTAIAADANSVVAMGDEAAILFDAQLQETGRLELDPPPEADARLPAVAVVDDGAIVSRGIALTRLRTDGSTVWQTSPADLELLLEGLPDAWQGAIDYDALAVSPDGSTIYGFQRGAGTTASDAATGAPIGFWQAQSVAIGGGGKLAFGDGFVLAGQDLIDLETDEVRPVATRTDVNGFSALSPEGTVVALGGGTGISLWAVNGDQLLAEAIPAPSASIASLDAAGTRASWLSFSASVFGLWDLTTEEVIQAVLGNAAQAYWLPSGALGTWDFSTESRAWDPDTFDQIGIGVPPQTWSMYLTTPDSRYAVLGELEPNVGQIRIVDLETSEEVAAIDDLITDTGTRQGTVGWADFSPDGSMMAVVRSSAPPALIDTTSWTVDRIIESPNGTHIRTAVFNEDGSGLALHTEAGPIYFYDVRSAAFTDGPIAAGAVNGPMMHASTYGPRDETFVVGVGEGVQLWDLHSGMQIGDIFPNEGLWHGSASFDGRFGITSIGDNVLVWNLDTSTWAEIACRAAGRDMTEAEWAQYGLTDTPYEPVCGS